MRKHIAKSVWLVPLLVFVACKGQQAQQQQAAEQKPAEGQTMEMAAATYQIEVQNPMPHTMIVYAKTDSGEVKLGSVPANGSTYFTLTEPGTMDVQLRAEDEAKTHEVTGTVHLMKGQQASWTIAAGQNKMQEEMKKDTSSMKQEGSGNGM